MSFVDPLTLFLTQAAADARYFALAGGFGGAPPLVTLTGASAAGAAGSGSRSDHTHGYVVPTVRATGTNTSMANDVDTAVPFATEDYDTDTMHDTAVNNTRITFKTAGVYLVTGDVAWPTNGTGYRWSAIRLNGATDIAQDSKTGATTVTDVGHSLSVQRKFAVNDFVELRVRQTTGGALALSTSGGPSLQATWIAVG